MFEWDEEKNKINIKKHGISFEVAVQVFEDCNRITLYDQQHSQEEDRFHCVGKVNENIVTVRFAIRGECIRIIGAGYWRKGKALYENRD